MIVQRLDVTPGDPFDPAAIALHLRVESDELVAEALRFARAAAAEAEAYAGLALLDQTVRVLWQDHEPAWGSHLPLPIGPVMPAAASSFTVAAAGQNISAGFALLSGVRPALAVYDLPEPPVGILEVRYRAGFGPTAASIPPDLAAAIADQAAAWFEQRAGVDMKGIGLSPHLARVAARYRPVRL